MNMVNGEKKHLLVPLLVQTPEENTRLPGQVFEAGELNASQYGQGPCDPRISALIHTPTFLRLQHIKQLGLVSRIWPHATHTRYEHSLGCYYLAKRALSLISPQRKGQRSQKEKETSEHAFLLAALLHDVGHRPFAHAFEGRGMWQVSHEQAGRTLIEGSELATVIERDYHLSPKQVADFIDPPVEGMCSLYDEMLRPLIAGSLDIDKLDYLVRDARGCQIPFDASVPLDFLAALRIGRPPGSAKDRLVLISHATHSLMKLLMLRYSMYTEVYWGDSNRAYNIMLVRAVQDALRSGSMAPEQLPENDADFLARLRMPDMPSSTQILVQALLQDQPYEILLTLSSQAEPLACQLNQLASQAQRCREIECGLASHVSQQFELEIADHEILLDVLCPKPGHWDMEGWISYPDPDEAQSTYMTWSDAIRVHPTGLASASQLRCPIHIRASARVAFLMRSRQDLLCSWLAQCLERGGEKER